MTIYYIIFIYIIFVLNQFDKLLDLVVSNLYTTVGDEDFYHPSFSLTIPDLYARSVNLNSNNNQRTYNFMKVDFISLYSTFFLTDW